LNPSANKWRKAWIGLGGNIGDVRAAMAAALDRLDAHDAIAVEAVSNLYRTPPWGLTDQPDFLNACAALVTSLPAGELLAACLDTERALKRERTVRWGPRTIDIDLLAFEGEEHDGDGLKLPHPRMLERAFVLKPLGDIAPDLTIAGRRVGEWLASCDQSGIAQIADAGQWREKAGRTGLAGKS